ncbi:MAG: hypothetical protein DDT21_02213 [Syntrophomonadaceae bacterium]|nr:hypothetical protein [Bacillota bacterium]
MENGEKILSLLEKMYIDLNGRLLDVDKRLLNLETGMSEIKTELGSVKTELGSVKTELGSVKTELGSVKTELGSVKAIVIKIEHDHGQKLGALFDGDKLISDKLDRVEAQVSKHEEIIFRRSK